MKKKLGFIIGLIVSLALIAPMSVFATTYPDWDVNQDGITNIGDVTAIGLQWGKTGTSGWIRADVNKDGIVNILDVVVVGRHYGETTNAIEPTSMGVEPAIFNINYQYGICGMPFHIINNNSFSNNYKVSIKPATVAQNGYQPTPQGSMLGLQVSSDIVSVPAKSQSGELIFEVNCDTSVTGAVYPDKWYFYVNVQCISSGSIVTAIDIPVCITMAR